MIIKVKNGEEEISLMEADKLRSTSNQGLLLFVASWIKAVPITQLNPSVTYSLECFSKEGVSLFFYKNARFRSLEIESDDPDIVYKTELTFLIES